MKEYETRFVGDGSNVAILVIPFIHGKNMYISNIDLEIVNRFSNLHRLQSWGSGLQNTRLVQIIGQLHAHHHIIDEVRRSRENLILNSGLGCFSYPPLDISDSVEYLFVPEDQGAGLNVNSFIEFLAFLYLTLFIVSIECFDVFQPFFDCLSGMPSQALL